MALGIFEQLTWLTTRVKRLCCAVDKLKESGAGSYKVYTALLTQSGDDTISAIINSSPLTIGVTYEIVDNTGINVTNVGSPNNNVGTKFVATGTTPSSWGSGSLSYIPSAPVVTVLENTIGNIWFTFTNTSEQTINSNNLFPVGKTYSTVQLNTELTIPDPTMYSIQQSSNSIITLFNFKPVAEVDGSPFTNTPIEIRVYN